MGATEIASWLTRHGWSVNVIADDLVRATRQDGARARVYRLCPGITSDYWRIERAANGRSN